ncbi:MAG: peptidylprolyl isomerase [Desulfuromonadales bacterium]|jgi:peptidylprolyl isomerase
MSAANSRAVTQGDQVRVNYIGRFADGSVFDSSEGHDPLEFTVGAGQVIEGFDQAVVGLKPGESRAVVVPPAEAYGEHLSEMVAEVERHLIPDHEKLMLGSMLEVSLEDGQTLEVQVVEISDESVVLDGNHPLAGKELHFEIEMLEFV